jgi:hypothetical protein
MDTGPFLRSKRILHIAPSCCILIRLAFEVEVRTITYGFVMQKRPLFNVGATLHGR